MAKRRKVNFKMFGNTGIKLPSSTSAKFKHKNLTAQGLAKSIIKYNPDLAESYIDDKHAVKEIISYIKNQNFKNWYQAVEGFWKVSTANMKAENPVAYGKIRIRALIEHLTDDELNQLKTYTNDPELVLDGWTYDPTTDRMIDITGTKWFAITTNDESHDYDDIKLELGA